MTEPTYEVCSACRTAACVARLHMCDQPYSAVEWADTPYPKDEDQP